MGNAKVTKVGTVFLLVFPDYYDDGFHGRRGGDLVTTLGISGYCMIFDLVMVCVFFLGTVLFWKNFFFYDNCNHFQTGITCMVFSPSVSCFSWS